MAADRTSPNGRVIGIDVIPAQPPRGVSTIQGNFLSHAGRSFPSVFSPFSWRFLAYTSSEWFAQEICSTVQQSNDYPGLAKLTSQPLIVQEEVKNFVREKNRGRLRFQPYLSSAVDEGNLTEEDLAQSSLSYLEFEKRADTPLSVRVGVDTETSKPSRLERDQTMGRTVDIVLSDMSEPWEQTDGFWKRSLSDPYYRMMNTSGINTRDHAGSIVS